jgi:NAD(P)-dependent dehydrogenase (short-subunit alcohol dehydrogenase family)
MNADSLQGARVVVTGAARGIGQGVAAMFAREGATVAGLDLRDGGETAGLCGERFRHFACDLTQPPQIAASFAAVDEWFGGAAPDVLVCVAGISPEVSFIDTPLEVFDEVFAVNVRAVFLCGQEAARRMRVTGGGRIINIASTASVQAWAMQSVYGASKGAVALLTKCMAIELAADGITVNAVGPGTIETPLAEHFLSDPRMHANELGRAPLGRLGTPEDIAVAVRFLARDARWMTGQVIYVDGGFLAAGLTMAPGDETRVSLER